MLLWIILPLWWALRVFKRKIYDPVSKIIILIDEYQAITNIEIIALVLAVKLYHQWKGLQEYLLPYVISQAVSLIILIAAWKTNQVGTMVFLYTVSLGICDQHVPWPDRS
jgi:succinate dehydrogenase hydrophobic anchor subunit